MITTDLDGRQCRALNANDSLECRNSAVSMDFTKQTRTLLVSSPIPSPSGARVLAESVPELDWLSLLRSGSIAYRATGAEWVMPYYIALLARACEIAGQIEEALTQFDEALQIVERTGERWFAAKLRRHKGRVLLRQGHSEAAEELNRKALSIAQEQGGQAVVVRQVVQVV
jgi:tetratricopeptide (TPR) repeat protein